MIKPHYIFFLNISLLLRINNRLQAHKPHDIKMKASVFERITDYYNS